MSKMKFDYEALDAQGQTVKDKIEAISPNEAIDKIRSLGMFPTKIRERGKNKPEKKSSTSF